MSKRYYPAVFHPEESGYSVIVPDLEGCFSEGDTLEEAFQMAADAIGLCVEEIQKNHGNLPQATNPAEIDVQKPDFISLIEYDPIEYAKKHDTKAIKKTLTIPAWLNQIAEQNHVNFSGILKEALIEHLNIR